MTHTDVVSSAYFTAVLTGEITSEIRRVRTPIVTGDRLILQERDDKNVFTGRELELKINSAQNKVKGLVQGYALVHFKSTGESAVTNTAIPDEAQINAGVDRANLPGAAEASAETVPAEDLNVELPLND